MHKVLHADDTPHAIAMGAAIATLVAFLPLVGVQTVIAIGLAALLRVNKAICVPIVWITNPFSLVPIYGACYGLGRLVMSSSKHADADVVLSKLDLPAGLGLFHLEFWNGLFHRLGDLGLELWVGCIIVGAVSAFPAYVVARWGVSAYRERRRQRLLRRSLMRATAPQRMLVRRSESNLK